MRSEIIVIGASIGGLKALETLLDGLDSNFSVPLVVVQHRDRNSASLLANLLQRHSSLLVQEVDDKQSISPGHVYLAPPDYHLLLEPGHCSLSLEAPVNFARPSIDVLFESAAQAYGSKCLGIILTGSNQDGAQGASELKAAGGLLIVQDPETCESDIMPKSVMAKTAVDHILSVAGIANYLNIHCSLSGRKSA